MLSDPLRVEAWPTRPGAGRLNGSFFQRASLRPDCPLADAPNPTEGPASESSERVTACLEVPIQ